MGALADDGGTVATTDLGFFTNTITNGKPQYTFPYPFPSNIAQPGTQSFALGFPRHFQDPLIHEWDLTLEQDLGKGVGIRVSYDGNHSSTLGTVFNISQVPANTVGFEVANTLSPFPLWSSVAYRGSNGSLNYNAATISAHKRFSRGLQFQVSYVFARNLADSTGYNPTGGSNEMGGQTFRPVPSWNRLWQCGLHGASSFPRYLSVRATLRQGKAFRGNANRVLDRVVGGWEVAGVIVAQTGQFLSVLAPGDPSGTGFNDLTGDGRADRSKAFLHMRDSP